MITLKKVYICYVQSVDLRNPAGLSCANPVCAGYNPWIGHAILGLLERKAYIRTILGLPCARRSDRSVIY